MIRSSSLCPLLLAAGIMALAASCLLGTAPLGPGAVASALLGQGTQTDRLIVWEVRLPRALAAYAAGMALGASGAALQGLLRNPLAEPGVLGVSAASALGATVVLYYGLGTVFHAALPTAAIAGALAATFFLAAIGSRQSSVTTLILIGVGLSSLCGALMSLLVNLSPNPFNLSDMVSWMLGSVANRSLADLGLALPFLSVGLLILTWCRGGLSVLSLGEEAAAGTGLDLVRTRSLVVLGTGLATGASVALAGAIGFVGIVAPHLVRPLVGHDPARTVIPSALLGGVLLVVADIAIRLAPTPTELRLGVVAALAGAPVFIWIASRRGMARD